MIIMSKSQLFASKPELLNQSASQQISEFLHSAVVQGTIKPGQRLLEESLAKELGVSRTPVREALRRLEADGLVEYIPQRGTVVRQISDEEVSQIYDVRVLIEGHAAKLAAINAHTQDILALEMLCNSFVAVMDSEENQPEKVPILWDLNNKFHTSIVEISGNIILTRIKKIALQVPGIYRIYYWYDDKNKESSRQFHLRIINAIKDRDGTKAEELMQQHLIEAKALIVKSMERTNPIEPPQTE
jgi:DNA-binding GntR family transcriptional regulator